MSYSDGLPREVAEFTRCQCLDEDGNRCLNHAAREVGIFADAEFNGDLLMAVNLCTECEKELKKTGT